MPYYIEVFATEGRACVHKDACDLCRGGVGPAGKIIDAGSAFWYPRHTDTGLDSIRHVERYLVSLGRRFVIKRCTGCMDSADVSEF